MNTTELLAQHLARTRYEDLPAEAVRATKEHILHTLATVLAGSDAPGCKTVVDLIEDEGGRCESTVLVYGVKVPAAQAALANSCMAHARDFCNNDDRIAYKSSVCAIPASLAVAEREGSVSGTELI
ncbi:MAG: MmgE/PrpD family protein, partial [Dehalococcoidia bacterium]